VLLPLLAACSTTAPVVPTPRAVEAEAARTARVQRGDISGVLTLSGEIHPFGQQTLTARVSGRLERLYAEVGSSVQEGQPIAELDRTNFDLRVVQGEAALAAAEARLATLLAEASPDDTAQAEAVLRAARARLEALEKAPRGDAPETLLERLQAARERVRQLEEAELLALTEAQTALSSARARVEQVERDNSSSRQRDALEDARKALQQAEQAAAAARRRAGTEEMVQARQELNTAQDQLILSRGSVSEADLEAARAAVQVAEAGQRRASNPPSEVEIKAAEAQTQRAQAELEVARLEARAATVLAPFSGVVGEVFAAPGSLVAPGTPLLTVVPPNFQVIVPLPETQVGNVAVGQPVRLGVDAFPGQEFTGAVKAIAPAVDPRTRRVAVRVEISDPAFKLKSGMFAQVAISSPPRRGSLLLPKEALLDHVGESVVYQVIEGRARRQVVQVGAVDSQNIEILAGLSEGAEVVISNSAQVEGAAVR
jgi:multidrug efflux pump subunit AcrA (membrane-fusion protein)